MSDTGNIIFPIISCVLIIISTFCFGFGIGVKKEHKRYEKWLKEHCDGIVNVFSVKDEKTGEYLSPEVYLTPAEHPDLWHDKQVVLFVVRNPHPREKT